MRGLEDRGPGPVCKQWEVRQGAGDQPGDTLATLGLHSAGLADGHSGAASEQVMAPLSLIDLPHLDGWAPQWDELVDAATLPSPFLRSWWLTGTSRSDRHFLLIVDDTQLLGGLALEERRRVASIRMMGYGSASDHLDLLAAPGHESAVVSLLAAWLRRPGGRLLDLKGIRAGSRLIEALPGRVRCEPMAVAPFAPLPVSADAYRSSLSPQFRRNLRRSAHRLDVDGVTQRTVRGDDVLASLGTLRELHWAQWGDRSEISSRLRSLRGRVRRRCGRR